MKKLILRIINNNFRIIIWEMKFCKIFPGDNILSGVEAYQIEMVYCGPIRCKLLTMRYSDFIVFPRFPFNCPSTCLCACHCHFMTSLTAWNSRFISQTWEMRRRLIRRNLFRDLPWMTIFCASWSCFKLFAFNVSFHILDGFQSIYREFQVE